MPVGGLILMAIVALWAGALAAAFGYAALIGRGELGDAKTLLYAVIGVALAVISARTGYELIRQVGRRVVATSRRDRGDGRATWGRSPDP